MSSQSSTIIRIKPAWRRNFWIFLGVFTTVVLWIFSQYVPQMVASLFVFDNHPSYRYFTGAFLALMLGGTIPIEIFLIYIGVFWWKYHIEFNEQGFEVHALRYHLSLKPFACRWTDIIKVTPGELTGTLLVTSKKQPPYLILTNWLEGQEQVLISEFQKHLDPSRMAPNTRELANLTTPFDRNILIIRGTLLLAVLIVAYFLFGHRFVASHVAWQSATSFGLRGNIRDFAVGPDSSIWSINANLFTDEIWHVSGGDKQQIPFPSDTELNRGVPTTYDYWPDEIAVDSLNRPWVSLVPHGLVHWNGTAWEWFTFPNGRRDVRIWELTTQNDHVLIKASLTPTTISDLYIDAATEIAHEYDLSEIVPSEELEKASITVTHRGPIVEVNKQSGQANLYWQDQNTGNWHSVITDSELGGLYDGRYAIDKNSRLWILTSTDLPCNQVGTQLRLGIYDPANRSWLWNNLEGNFFCGSGNYYQGMVVDSHDRLWFQTSQYLDAFELNSTGTLNGVVRYTSNNSNYQNGFAQTELDLQPDDRLWSAGREVAWIDTNATELPRPLPDWLSNLASQEATLIWLTLSFIISITSVLITLTTRSRMATARTARTELISQQ